MGWLCYRMYFRGLALLCSLVIAPGEAFLYGQAPQSHQTAKTQTAQLMSPEQLDSLVAPIALYPDPLLAQVLAASTYPLQIVTAYRWMQQNQNLKGKDLLTASGKQDWDPSIQALVAFPTVLQMLDQSIDWTNALGAAFLSQQSDVMAAVQRMRMKAQEGGKLQSNAQQQVQTSTVEGQPTIVIQPANPEVIYVPTYEPAAVYGAPPPYYPYPAVVYPTGAVWAGGIGFGVGVAVGALFNGCCGGGWGWGWGCNWGHHGSLYVNNNFFNHNRNTFVNRGNWGGNYVGNGRGNWSHNNRWGGARPGQLPANVRNTRQPGAGSIGGANRLPGNAGGGNVGGRGARPGQVPSNIGGANRAGERGRASQLPANPSGNRGGGRGGPNLGPNRPGGGVGGGNRTPGSIGSANRMSNGMGGRTFGGGGGNRGFANRGGGGRSFGGGGGHRGGGGARRGGGGRRR